MLGPDVLGSGKAFELEVRVGAGAYVCGEETSLLNSLEGKRGVVRAKPPLPALEGAFGKILSMFIMVLGISLFLRLVQALVRPSKVKAE